MWKVFCLGLIVAINLAFTIALPSSRVVGGVDAVEAQFPHQVSLRREGSHTCGGSILSRNFVLTAAHCVTTDTETGWIIRDGTFTIRAGSNDRLTGGVVLTVVEITVHEKYGDLDHDVALLKLESPLIYSKNIQPAQLPITEVPPGADVIISGWGRLKTNGDIPIKLQWNTLVAKQQSECGFSDTLICLSHKADNGACNGDSGGPALYNGRLASVAGFVIFGCGTRFPDGYANVFYHVDWIKKHSDL